MDNTWEETAKRATFHTVTPAQELVKGKAAGIRHNFDNISDTGESIQS